MLLTAARDEADRFLYLPFKLHSLDLPRPLGFFMLQSCTAKVSDSTEVATVVWLSICVCLRMCVCTREFLTSLTLWSVTYLRKA